MPELRKQGTFAYFVQNIATTLCYTEQPAANIKLRLSPVNVGVFSKSAAGAKQLMT